MSKAYRALTDLFAALNGRIEPRSDWTALLQQAAETLTIGTLAAGLARSTDWNALPKEVRDLLSDVLDRANARNEKLRAQALELAGALNAVGVEPIIMRGMANVISGNQADGRLISDVDILIPEGKRDRGVETLLSLGYTIHQGFHGPPFSVVLARTVDVGMVDIHTSLQPYRLGVGFDRIAPLCQQQDFSGTRVLTPGPTGSMLLNILHDQLHDGDYWRGLIDVRHIAEFPRMVDQGVDWQALAAFFPDSNARNALEVQLRTAKRLFGLDIPEAYCGGAWAKAQVSRRMAQLRFPVLMPLLTIGTLLVDPPRGGPKAPKSRRPASRKWRFKFDRALGPVNAGKAGARST